MITETERYTAVAKALHWIVALMIIVQIPAGFFMHNLEPSSLKYTLYQLHKSSGLIILALSLFRLGWRLTHRPPALSPKLKAWERVLARITHVGFYALIILIPLTGWLLVSASTTGIPTKIFWLIPVPHLPVPQGEAEAEFWVEIHELFAKGMIGLLALHVAGALKHHFKDKDQTLRRMLPKFAGGLSARQSFASKEKSS